MIPTIIHQTWKDNDVPPHLQTFQVSWHQYQPDWEYRLWTDIDNRTFLAEHYAWFLPIYDNYPMPIMRVDAARCFILHHFGGIYADLDYECLRPIAPLLDGKELVLGCEPEEHTQRAMAQGRGVDRILSNAFMATVADHPFWEHVFKEMVGAHLAPNPLDATGPFVLTRAYQSYPNTSDISIEPPAVLFPLDEGEMWDAQRKKTVPPKPPSSAYAVHHWQGSWWRIPEMRWHTHQLAKTTDLAQKTMARVGDMLDGEVRRKKEYLNERFFPQKQRIRDFMQVTGAPLPIAIMPEAATQAWYGALNQGKVVSRAIVDVEATQRFVEGLTDPPLVTAMMVTKGRPQLAQRSIHCFLNQTYPNCELVILDDDEEDTLANWVAALNDKRIRHLRLKSENRSLGALRNLAVDEARGAYVAQWDDDDLSHPQRFTLEMGLLLLHNADACFLQRETLWAPSLGRIAFSNRRLWEGSFVCAKIAMLSYPEVGKGEDSPVADGIFLNRRVIFLDYPQLYTYVFHDKNTHEDAHFAHHWAAATARYEGGSYDIAVRQLQNDLNIDLAPWIENEPASRYDRPVHIRPAARPNKLDAYSDILILTPVKNAAQHIPRYVHNLRTLGYPHDKLALAFLEGDSDDGSYELLTELLPELAAEFRSARLFKEDSGYQSELPRWAISQQRPRRAAISRSRNSLLMRALADEAWVLWIDADLQSYPPDVIEKMLAVQKEIVVPHCLLPDGRTFDLNTFKLKPGAAFWDWSPDIIDGILQPPMGHGRYYLSDLRDRECVELDGVGGTMLLVRTDVHRAGAIFPASPYRYLLDTEGFAAMAKDLGYTCWGLPNLEIIHPAL